MEKDKAVTIAMIVGSVIVGIAEGILISQGAKLVIALALALGYMGALYFSHRKEEPWATKISLIVAIAVSVITHLCTQPS